jgi:hypothetical protein
MPMLRAAGHRRTTALTLVLVAMTGATALASDAGAATIHACVRPKSGATRIVKAHAKCRRGEQKLTWNTSGPQGERGAPGPGGSPGAEGRAGSSGTGPVYVGTALEPRELKAGEPLLASKVVPPGIYAVSAKTLLGASSEVEGATTAVLCSLTDTPGTALEGETAELDVGGWEAPLAKLGVKNFGAAATIGLEGTLTSKVTSTVVIACGIVESEAPPVLAESTRIQATAVTAVL